MSLDRDELAARATAARAALLSLCEALSALVPVAPATRTTGPVGHTTVVDADAPTGTGRPVAPDSGAPATEPRRTVGAVVRTRDCAEFVVVAPDRTRRIDLAPIGDPRLDGPPLYDTDTFVRWATREECERHGIPYVARPLPGAPLAAPSRPEWVPSVGDVVRLARPPSGDEWECFMDAKWTYNRCDEGRVVETDKYHADNGKVSVVRANGDRPDDLHGVEACRLVLVERPSERAAAGLPVDVEESRSGDDRPASGQSAGGWMPMLRVEKMECPACGARFDSIKAPAIAPAFDRAEFNEAQEREAARVAYWKENTVVCSSRNEATYIAGWLARARVAAKGGAS